ncbi:MAG: amidohydrolase family protein [Bacteroidota bacterium]
MILRNVTLAQAGHTVNIKIDRGKIVQINPAENNKCLAPHIDFTGAIAFPGLINSHDHLDFNLFPQLGDKIYHNYTEWGNHIHQAYAGKIAAILKIPIALREEWGVYKNLLCGVTTVINHGRKLTIRNPPISVLEDSLSLHSVCFERNWRAKLNNPFNIRKKAVIHIGEGTDQAAQLEIDTLAKWNLLGRPLIGIHGVALCKQQAKAFEAIVWCPQSNYFLLGRTANVKLLQAQTQLLFGTDSTLTSCWNIWEHIRTARSAKLLSDNELYETLTLNPAKTWGLNSGDLAIGKQADLVVVKSNGLKGLAAFFEVQSKDILMVMCAGEIKLYDESLKFQLKSLANFSKISVNNSFKYVTGNINQLMKDIRKYQPQAAFPAELSNC